MERGYDVIRWWTGIVFFFELYIVVGQRGKDERSDVVWFSLPILGCSVHLQSFHKECQPQAANTPSTQVPFEAPRV